MRITKIQLVAAGIVTAVVVGAAVYLLTTGRDTPIIIIGGCIHPKADKSPDKKWSSDNRNQHYHASVGRHGDTLILTNFDNTSSRTLSSTGRWAITYTDQNNGNSPSRPKVCSDPNCAASTTDFQGNPKVRSCNSPVDPGGPVHVHAGSNEHWLETSAGPDQLAVKENSTDCPPDSGQPDGACEKVSSILIETCNAVQGPNKDQTSFTYQCTPTGSGPPTGTAENQGCNVSIGGKYF